ncbi:MAG: glycosyltransferase family 39 protein [Actinomycetota bacterium]|nr:glycosyltransferase family 39 protein [Actinomycetota bacterium]
MRLLRPVRKLFWPLLFLLILASLVSGMRSVQGRDSAVFMYIGQQALDGRLPYLDLWDHKPPGIYFLDAVGLLLTRDLRGVWLLEYLSYAIAGGCGFLALRRVFDARSALFGTALLLVSVPLVLDGGNLTEEFGLSTQFATLYLICRGVGRTLDFRTSLFVGLLAGFAVLLKPNLAGLWIALGLSLVLTAAKHRMAAGLLRTIGGIALGVGTPIVLVCAYFSWRGALAPMADAVVTYNYWYAHYVTWTDRWGILVAGLSLLSNSLLIPFAIVGWLMAVTVLAKKRFADVTSFVLLVGIIWLPLELAFALLSGRSYPHNYMPWLAVLTLLAGASVWAFQRFLELHPGRLSSSLNVALVLVLIAGAVPAARRAREAFAEPSDYALTRTAVASYIELTTRRDDKIYVWGAESSIYLETDRRAPTRYIYVYPLYTRGYQSPELIEELLADFTASPPTLIVDASTAAIQVVPPLSREERSRWIGSDAAYAGLPEMDQIFEFISANYLETTRLGPSGWPVYRHR